MQAYLPSLCFLALCLISGLAIVRLGIVMDRLEGYKLERIQAALRQCIEEASRATPGPWRMTSSYYIMAGKEVVTDVFETESGSMPANALFVATARTMGPIGWQALLDIIAAAECRFEEGIEAEFADIILRTVAASFPDTLPVA